MIILIINDIGVAVLKTESQPPVAGNFDRPMPLEVAFELMESGTGEIHIFHCVSKIQQIKYISQPCGVLRLNALADALMEKGFKSLMAKTLYHARVRM